MDNILINTETGLIIERVLTLICIDNLYGQRARASHGPIIRKNANKISS